MEFKIYDNPQKGYRFANKLIEERGHRCECCGNSEWLGQPIKLQVHHISGDKRDNRRENLQLLCLNCHAFTDNFCCKTKDKSDYKKDLTDKEYIQMLFNLAQQLDRL